MHALTGSPPPRWLIDFKGGNGHGAMARPDDTVTGCGRHLEGARLYDPLRRAHCWSHGILAEDA